MEPVSRSVGWRLWRHGVVAGVSLKAKRDERVVSRMTEHLHVVVEDETYEQLVQAKEDHGLSWEGLLLHAAKDLERSE